MQDPKLRNLFGSPDHSPLRRFERLYPIQRVNRGALRSLVHRFHVQLAEYFPTSSVFEEDTALQHKGTKVPKQKFRVHSWAVIYVVL